MKINKLSYPNLTFPFTINFKSSFSSYEEPYRSFLEDLHEGVHQLENQFSFYDGSLQNPNFQCIYIQIVHTSEIEDQGVLWDYSHKTGLMLIRQQDLLKSQLNAEKLKLFRRIYTDIQEIIFQEVIDLNFKNNYSLTYI